jgi:hypothetical protein
MNCCDSLQICELTQKPRPPAGGGPDNLTAPRQAMLETRRALSWPGKTRADTLDWDETSAPKPPQRALPSIRPQARSACCMRGRVSRNSRN